VDKTRTETEKKAKRDEEDTIRIVKIVETNMTPEFGPLIACPMDESYSGKQIAWYDADDTKKASFLVEFAHGNEIDL
jgi:hypothetical protein